MRYSRKTLLEMRKISHKHNCPVFNLFEKTSIPCVSSFSMVPVQKRFNTWATPIIPNLWLGSYDDAVNIEKLKENSVRCVLNISEECEIPKIYDSENIAFHQFPIKDHSDADIKSLFAKTCKIIFDCLGNGQGVLVHCRMGVSRSATIVIAFLMNFGFSIENPEKKSYSECFRFVKDKREKISPNLGFCLSLREYSSEIGFEEDIFY